MVIRLSNAEAPQHRESEMSMHRIERKKSGYVLTFGGHIDIEEMRQWLEESKQVLTSEKDRFCVIVDMKTLAPLMPETQQVMVEGQKLYKQKGMTRSSVILNNAVTAIQFKRLAQTSGIYAWERYFDGSQADCDEKAVVWGRDGVDPDKMAASCRRPSEATLLPA